MDEAIIGFKRAANTHGWKVSKNILSYAFLLFSLKSDDPPNL